MSLGAELAASPPAALAGAMAGLRWRDLGLDLASQLPPHGWSTLKLHVDDDCEVGLFFLRRGEHIPLHDHPGLHVWMRVLTGELDVTSYTWADPPYARRTGAARLGPDAPVWLVEPRRDNLHTLTAAQDVAFLDVLRPPYRADGPCTYYRALPTAADLWRMQPLT